MYINGPLEKKINKNICHISSKQIVNQHRFPIQKFGWPLYNAALLIKKNDIKRATLCINKLHLLRKKMNSINDIYGIDSLGNFSINSVFFPWFNKRPIYNNKIQDNDYNEKTHVNKSISKLVSLLKSISENGYIIQKNHKDNIIGYQIGNFNGIEKFYIRAGNHRCAVLSALGKKIPLVLDNFSFLKKRDRKILSNDNLYLYIKNILNFKNMYPNIPSIENFNCVRSKNLSYSEAKKIMDLFTNFNSEY